MKGAKGNIVIIFTILSFLAISIPVSVQASSQSHSDVAQERVLVYIQTFDENQKQTITSRPDVNLRFAFDDNWISVELPIHVKEKLENRDGVLIEDVSLFTIDAKKDCNLDPNHPGCKDNNDEPSPDPEPTPTREFYPSSQITWGLKEIYNDQYLDASDVLIANNGQGVNVAVLDTGVLKEHPDLANKIALCKDFTSGKRPKNTCADGHGHGTHVSGTVLADGGSDKLGILGVAPGSNLFAYKVCTNGGSCFGDAVSAGIRDAEKNGANIISMSFGGSTFSTVEKKAIDDALRSRQSNDLLFIAAAGNSGPSSNTIKYPAAYHKVVAVAAVDSSLTVASFSSRGIDDIWQNDKDRLVEVSGPGVAVESTMNNGRYAVWSGTSMATPHISGLAASVWSDNNGQATDVREWLQNNRHDLGPSGYDRAYGFGFSHLN